MESGKKQFTLSLQITFYSLKHQHTYCIDNMINSPLFTSHSIPDKSFTSKPLYPDDERMDIREGLEPPPVTQRPSHNCWVPASCATGRGNLENMFVVEHKNPARGLSPVQDLLEDMTLKSL